MALSDRFPTLLSERPCGGLKTILDKRIVSVVLYLVKRVERTKVYVEATAANFESIRLLYRKFSQSWTCDSSLDHFGSEPSPCDPHATADILHPR